MDERRWGLPAIGLLGVFALSGCDDPRAGAPAAPLPTAPSSPLAPPSPATPSSPATPLPPSTTALVSEPGEPPMAPRPLDEILFELEEIETAPANLDDPEADYEARYERQDELEAEARRLGPDALDLLFTRLEEARGLPDVVGARERRPFLLRVIGGLDHDRARAAIGQRLRALPQGDVRAILAAMPRHDASRGAIAGWFLRASEFARATGGGDPALRLALLEAHLARRPAGDAAEDEVVAAALADPSAEVAARARR